MLISLLGGLAIPVSCFGVVLRHASAVIARGQQTDFNRPYRPSEITIADVLNDYASDRAAEVEAPERISYRGTYKNGKREGPWVEYYYHGQLKSKGTYKDGKEHGPWISYNRNGTVSEERTGTFKHGVRVK